LAAALAIKQASDAAKQNARAFEAFMAEQLG
jgi:hypothetical protein